ncbi:XRE family transcriptional regulator [Falsiroseomonas bella]|uniref:XRE family transcriptional regulator n=2 Tax=Falsiroseomonas bella TaxID=2184016 RepID=A0A317F6L6_9PROT|nr:XRE family transcriptional regulator [Falsiroseomonas bella]
MVAMTKPLAGRGETSADYKRDLGLYIRDLRMRRGLTQAELAKAVGMTYYTSISAIEVGRNVVPSERYMAFAEALDVDPRIFGRRVLALTNPWMHAMLFASRPKEEIERLNAVLGQRSSSQ